MEQQKQIHEAWCGIHNYNPGVCDCNDTESVVSDNEIFLLLSIYSLGLERNNILCKFRINNNITFCLMGSFEGVQE